MTRVIVESDDDSIALIEMRLAMRGAVYLTSLKGLGAVSPRESGTDIPQQDGEYAPSRLTSGGRNISIGGAVAGCSSIEAADLEDRICALMNQDLMVTVEDAHGRRRYRGWLADDPEPSMFTSQQAFTFTLIIHVPDPLKYGDPLTFPVSNGMARVENPGRASSYPRIRVDGHITSLSLSYGYQSLQWHGDAQLLDLDLRDMLPSSGAVSGQSFQIIPGSSTVSVAATAGAAVSVIVLPAWR